MAKDSGRFSMTDSQRSESLLVLRRCWLSDNKGSDIPETLSGKGLRKKWGNQARRSQHSFI